MPLTIELTNFKRGKIFLNFGDIKTMNPPSKITNAFMVEDFKNSIDLSRNKTVLQNKEVYLSLFTSN